MGKISYSAANLGQGGLTEGDVTIVGFKFVESDPDKTGGNVLISAVIEYLPDGEGEPTPRFYQVGRKIFKGTAVAVSEDGLDLEVLDDDTEYKVWEKSDLGLYITALENSGFSTARLDDEGWSAVIGEKFHVEKVSTYKSPDGSKEKFNLFPTKYLGSEGGAKKSKASKKSKAAPAAEVDVDEIATTKLLEYLAAADAPLKLNEIQRNAFRDKEIKALDKDAKKAVMARLIDTDFLSTEDGWEFDEEEGTVEA
jgi:hypothetical protein